MSGCWSPTNQQAASTGAADPPDPPGCVDAMQSVDGPVVGASVAIPAIVVYHGSSCTAADADMQRDPVDTDPEDGDCASLDQPPTPNGTVGSGGASNGPGGGLQRQSRSLELVPGHPDRHHTLPRQKMLMRSQAMREESSPPPELELAPRYGGAHLSGSGCGSQPLRKFHSQGSTDAAPCGSPHLSRDFSGEIYTDSKGVDVERFLAEALNANVKDQAHLLKYEQDMVNFIEDNGRSEFRFPPQSSYQRMLVHRAAVYFGLDHNVDPTGTCVIITKTDRTRIPENRFRDLLRDDGDEPKSLLKREAILGHYSRSFDSQSSLESRRSKSFEERETDYKRTRTRIFNNPEELELDGWHGGGGRPGLGQPRRHMPSKAHSVDQPPRYARLSKTDSLEGGGGGPPAGAGAGGALRLATARPPGVAKSHSFGGYTGAALSRADSTASQPPACGGRLAKQDSSVSSVSRLSPSSGYKTASVSQMTLDSTPSPTSNQCYSLEEAPLTGRGGESQPVLWAVSNLEDVPAGSVIIDPHSGQPYLNADRTIYRFNPANPPQLAAPPAAPAAPVLPAPHGYQPLPLSLPTPAVGGGGGGGGAGGRYVGADGCGPAVQYVQYVTTGSPPAAPPLQYAAPALYPVVAGAQPTATLQQCPQTPGEKPLSELGQQLLSLGLSDAAGGSDSAPPAAQPPHYLLTYRGLGSAAAAAAGPQPPPLYCVPGPVPVRYMAYQPVLGAGGEQTPQQYMGVYPSGAVPAAADGTAGYYVPSPSAASPAVYPVSPYYAGAYPGTPGARPAAELTANGQQVLGVAGAAPYGGGPPAGGVVTGRLVAAGPGAARLRYADSGDEPAPPPPPPLQTAPHSMPPPTVAYQRTTLPLNAVRLVAPLRPGCQPALQQQQQQQPFQPASAAAPAAARPGRARRSRARSKPGMEPALTPTPEPGCVLEVDGCWPGLRRCELERHLQEAVCGVGGRLQYGGGGGAGSPPVEAPLPSPPLVTAVFDSPAAAEAALLATRGAPLRLRRPDH